MAVASISISGLGVAVVEAAFAVVVGPVEDRVDALRRVAGSYAASGVVAVAGAGRYKDTIRLLPVQRDRGTDRTGKVVVAIGLRAAGGAAGRTLGEVITAAGLVVNDSDDAGRAGAEGVLSGSIGDPTGGQRRDGGRGKVGTALHLVEGAGVGVVQSASGAVRGDAGRAAGGVDIAGPSSNKGARSNKA